MFAKYIWTAVLAIANVKCCFGSPSNWDGTFTDSVYGGNIQICTTYVASSNTYYGQGFFSNIGYMRGTISPTTDVFTGEFWMAGVESIHGTFSLNLNINIGVTYSGTFTESKGNSYTFSGDQVSSAIPSDSECLRVDEELLVSTEMFDLSAKTNYNGQNSNGTTERTFFASGTTIQSSFSYMYSSAYYNYGNLFRSGQIACMSYYGAGSNTGIELLVAKNTELYYSFWWTFDYLSDFDYSMKSVDNYGFDLNYVDSVGSQSDAEENAYLIFSTENLEESCEDDSSDSDDDSSDGVLAVAAAILAFTILIFVGVVAILIILLSSSKAPLSSQGTKADSQL